MAEAYIIPGFGHTGKELPYSLIRNEFNTKNIESKVIRIKWEYRTMKDYISQFLDKCQNPNPRILGFSFGAMIAFI